MAKLILEEVLKRKNITKYRFAQLLGTQQPAVFRFFKPEYDPKLSTLAEWAKVLNVKIKDLYQE
jgi:DNA-binding XRE family transcriptional regulator